MLSKQNGSIFFDGWTFIWKLEIWNSLMKSSFGQMTATADLAIAHSMHPIIQVIFNCFMLYISMNFCLEICNCLWIVGVIFIYQRTPKMALNRRFLVANSHHHFCWLFDFRRVDAKYWLWHVAPFCWNQFISNYWVSANTNWLIHQHSSFTNSLHKLIHKLSFWNIFFLFRTVWIELLWI